MRSEGRRPAVRKSIEHIPHLPPEQRGTVASDNGRGGRRSKKDTQGRRSNPSGRKLHGSAPDKSDVTLLLIDVINDFDFPEADQLLEHALPAARKIARLARRCRKARIPVVYANDNFGRCRSDVGAVVRHCLKRTSRGRRIVRLLHPRSTDYLVLKPKHSALYSSSLETLLGFLGVRHVILAGFAANICVLFTANDLYMRDYQVTVPRDCCASNSKEENDNALRQMTQVLKADLRESALLNVELLRTQ